MRNCFQALDILSLEFYLLLRSSIYPLVAVHDLTMAVVVPKPNCQLPINCTSVNKLIICHCQQPSSVAVNKHHLPLSTNIICRCQQTVQLPPVPKPIQLKQTSSPKTAITRPKNVSKEIINQLCILCCVLCIVCSESQYGVVPIIKCKFVQQNLIFFHKNKNLICVNN